MALEPVQILQETVLGPDKADEGHWANERSGRTLGVQDLQVDRHAGQEPH